MPTCWAVLMLVFERVDLFHRGDVGEVDNAAVLLAEAQAVACHHKPKQNPVNWSAFNRYFRVPVGPTSSMLTVFLASANLLSI